MNNPKDRERERHYREFVNRVHLYQQYTSDPYPIDAEEFQRRLASINFQTNVVTYETELSQDTRANELVQQVLTLLPH